MKGFEENMSYERDQV